MSSTAVSDHVPTAPSSTLSAHSGNQRLREAIAAVRAKFPRTPDPTAASLELNLVRLGDILRAQPSLRATDAAVPEILAVVRELAAIDRSSSLSSEELASLIEEAQGSWSSLLALMVLGTSDDCATAPSLDDVPEWLWKDYASWLFAPLQWGRGSRALLQRVEELASWLKRNRGSARVRAAVEQWKHCARVTPRFSSPEENYRYARARGQILQTLCEDRSSLQPLPPYSRLGRRLRLAVVCEVFEADEATAQVLGLVQHLDPAEYDVSLLAREIKDAAVERWSPMVAPVSLIPANVAEAVSAMQGANFDVILFAGDLSGTPEQLDPLAFHRLAPLQVAGPWTNASSGLPEVDVLLATEASGTNLHGGTTERLAILRGWRGQMLTPSSLQPALHLTREALNLPATATLLGAVVTTEAVSEQTIELWARALAAVPEAQLMVAYTGQASETFCRHVEAGLRGHGVQHTRASIFPADLGQPAEIAALIGLSDVFLDTEPTGNWWMHEAIRQARPLVRLPSGRPTPALLQALELSDVEAVSPTSAAALILQAVGTADARAAGQRHMEELRASPSYPNFDTLAASEALAGALESAFDELVALGPDALRDRQAPPLMQSLEAGENRDALAAAEAALAAGDLEMASFESQRALRAAPGAIERRILRGRVLLAEGRSDRALHFLLSAAELGASTGEVWRWIADAYEAQGRLPDAIEAVEASLRLNPQNVAVWLKLARLAEGAAATDIAQDALTVLRGLAPDHPEVLELAQRLAA